MPTFDQSLEKLRKQASSITKQLEADNYIFYATSTKEPAKIFGQKVDPSVIPHLIAQLKTMGKSQRLVLFLHTNGGDLSAPWPIVSLLREYCNELYIVIVERALSAGTLISIAADRIIMGPDAFLSPVDPQAHVVINGQKRDVEVEDVTGYIEFVKTKVGLSGGSGLEKAFESLTNEITPTIIGKLFRTHALIRSLASKMLATRSERVDGGAEKQIVENLTEKLFSHGHLISRQEAKDYVGLRDAVILADSKIEKAIDDLSQQLAEIVKTNERFEPVKLLGSKDQYTEDFIGGLLLSATNSNTQKTKITITKKDQNNININAAPLGWF